MDNNKLHEEAMDKAVTNSSGFPDLFNKPISITDDAGKKIDVDFSDNSIDDLLSIDNGTNSSNIVYAPYIPLITSAPDSTPPGMVPATVPLWLGEIRSTGLHGMVVESMRNPGNNVSFINKVKQATENYTWKHKNDKFTIPLMDYGTKRGISVIHVIFREIFSQSGDSSWTTPFRLSIYIPDDEENAAQHISHRLIYGGHFFMVGCIELSDKYDYVKNANIGTVVSSVDEIDKIVFDNIYWDDYKCRKNKPLQVL